VNAPLPAAVAAAAEGGTLRLQVRAIRWQADGIHAYELADADDAELPEVQAGAHVDVHLPGQHVRSYSLAGDPRDRRTWTLGVLREVNGRGGSKALHDQVHVGDFVEVGAPRNAFGLKPGADHVVLVAGGIGITPLKAMAHVLAAEGRSFELHYCARSRRNAAFIDELRGFVPEGRLHLHFDDGDVRQGLDIARLLREPGSRRHVYYCGPGGFMKACADATAHWPAGTVHSEHFKAPEPPAKPAGHQDGSFDVKLARSGITLHVASDQTIVRAIELAGHRVPTSCLSGLCGSCKVGVLEGEVDHQDYILNDDERAHCMTVCVSRAKGPMLVLDL
jgi:ferredoxin-NADP reductase